jgi:hypothetical protein
VTARSRGCGEGRVLEDAWGRISRCLEGRWQRLKWPGGLPGRLNYNLTFGTPCRLARLMERRRRVLNADGHCGSPGRESHLQCLAMARGYEGSGRAAAAACKMAGSQQVFIGSKPKGGSRGSRIRRKSVEDKAQRSSEGDPKQAAKRQGRDADEVGWRWEHESGKPH